MSDRTLVNRLNDYLELPQTRDLGLESRAVLDGLPDTPSIDQVFRSIVEHLADPGASIIGEKTPRHALWVDYLLERDPQLQVFWVVRDPRAVVASLRTAPFGMSDVATLAELWRQDVRHLWRLQKRGYSPRIRVVRFEEMIADADATQADSWDFLGVSHRGLVPQKPRKLFVEGERAWKAKALDGADPSRIHAWRELLDPYEVAQIESRAQREMSRLGYEPLTHGSTKAALRGFLSARRLRFLLELKRKQRRIASMP